MNAPDAHDEGGGNSNGDADWERGLLVRGGMLATRVFATRFHRLHVAAPFPAAVTGRAIIVCNHVSHLDPVFVQAAMPRLVVWMMAKEYFDAPGIHFVCSTVRAIPVERRGRDLAATRSALRALAEGRILGLFPEGRLETSWDLLPFQTGVALLAARSAAPVVPAYLVGTQRGKSFGEAYLHPQSAVLRFGAPLTVDRADAGREALEAMTARIQGAVEALRREAMAGSPVR